jgi:8-oxo-dGTP pyrophosphatase MutT (NUDIX family)
LVIEPRVDPGDVECVEVECLRLVEVSPPEVSVEYRLAMDRVWDEAVLASRGALFDGPVVVCVGLERGEAGGFEVLWAPVTYRHFALRRVPGAVALPAIFVAVVQPTTGGRVLVGRMSASTAAPGRWQLPGGSVEPPGGGQQLDVAALGRHAARELAEETGIEVAGEELRLWVVTRGEHGNVGVFFLAPCWPESVLRERFAGVVSATRALGGDPELVEIAFVGSVGELAELGGPHADYSESVVGRYLSGLASVSE